MSNSKRFLEKCEKATPKKLNTLKVAYNYLEDPEYLEHLARERKEFHMSQENEARFNQEG